MAVVPMSKILLLLHKEDKQKTLELLQEEGVMEILNCSGSEETNSINTKEHGKISFKIAEVEFALNFLNKYAPTHKGLEGALLGEKVKVKSLEDIHNVRKNFFYQDIIEKCKNLEEKLNQYKVELSGIQQNITDLIPWSELKLDLNIPRETKTAKLIIGSMNLKKSEECFAEIKKTIELSEHKVIAEEGNQIKFWLLVEKENTQPTESILQKYAYTEFIAPTKNGTPAEIIKELTKEAKEIEKKINILKRERGKIAKNVPNLRVIYDYLNWVIGKEEIKNQFNYTESTVTIIGFVPTSRLDNLKKELETISKSITIEELAITKEDDVPVELENKNVVKPFEGVMKLFGLPAKEEADPTPFLAPFFLIFFGFCLTDVGYGLILGLGLFLFLRFVKVPQEMKGMLRLIMYAGWSTVVMGVLFGGYLGLTVDQAPDFMLNAEGTAFKFQVFDPINNLNAVMAFAYGLGLFQLWLGTLLKGIQTAKTSKWNAIQGQFSYNVLVLLLILYSFSATGIFLSEQTGLLKNIMFGVGLFTLWGSAYETKNVFLKPIIGAILFIQEIIAIFSGVLSYSRLFALGLSTGIIALVFNTIAITMFDLMPIFVAIPAMIIILIIGHTLNIALNVLGAFIHSARLQFVEFFGKFLIGGGKTFQPFKKDMKYIVINKD